MIALTAIVVAWSIAGALTLASAVLFEHQTNAREAAIGWCIRPCHEGVDLRQASPRLSPRVAASGVRA